MEAIVRPVLVTEGHPNLVELDVHVMRSHLSKKEGVLLDHARLPNRAGLANEGVFGVSRREDLSKLTK